MSFFLCSCGKVQQIETRFLNFESFGKISVNEGCFNSLHVDLVMGRKPSQRVILGSQSTIHNFQH